MDAMVKVGWKACFLAFHVKIKSFGRKMKKKKKSKRTFSTRRDHTLWLATSQKLMRFLELNSWWIHFYVISIILEGLVKETVSYIGFYLFRFLVLFSFSCWEFYYRMFVLISRYLLRFRLLRGDLFLFFQQPMWIFPLRVTNLLFLIQGRIGSTMISWGLW